MCIYIIYRNNNNSDNKLSLNIVLKWNCLPYSGDKTIRFYLYLCPYCPVQDTICKAFDWHPFIKCMNWIGVRVGGTNICACTCPCVYASKHGVCGDWVSLLGIFLSYSPSHSFDIGPLTEPGVHLFGETDHPGSLWNSFSPADLASGLHVCTVMPGFLYVW